MYLKQDSLVIRAATVEDAECLCNWWSDGAVMAHAGFPNGVKTDIDKLRNNLERQKDREVAKTLIIEVDSKPVGEMSFGIDNGIAEIGIKICDFSYQEKGFGTKVLKMLINYLFANKPVEKIVLDTNLSNTRAQHVYEKLGFKKVCIRENSWKNQFGELQSSVDYELIRESKMKTHIMKLNQEPFNLIKEGKKTIEMRLNDEKRKKISVGDIIKFLKTDSSDIELKVVVKKIHRYENFNELYRHFDKVKLGYYENQIAMPNDMEQYYSKDDIQKYGVVGIEIEVL